VTATPGKFYGVQFLLHLVPWMNLDCDILLLTDLALTHVLSAATPATASSSSLLPRPRRRRSPSQALRSPTPHVCSSLTGLAAAAWLIAGMYTVFSGDARIDLISFSSDDRGPEYSIFVGDLGPEVNEFVLVSLFQSRFPSCKSAKIMTDAMTGQSRGYGFVRFSEESDQQRALVEMQGVYCGNRPMRISTATPKTRYV